MNKAYIALCASLVAMPAAATDWRIVTWNEEFVLFLDHSAIQRNRRTASYTSKILYVKDPQVTELLSQIEVRCSTRQYRSVAVTALSRSGRLDVARISKEWRTISPGTNAEREFSIVCG
jgi:hypothetical protein